METDDPGEEISVESGMGFSFDLLSSVFDKEKKDLRTYSSSALAYIGDTIFDLLVRSAIVGAGNCPVNKMHRQSTDIVKAGTQARIYECIEERLTEEEADVMRRGRNSHQRSMAKNASAADYQKATGLEALIGYLYMKGDEERILELLVEEITERL